MHPENPEPSGRRGVLLNVIAILLITGIFGFFGWRLRGDWEVFQDVDWWAHPGLLASHLVLLLVAFGVLVLGWVRTLSICGGNLAASPSAFTWLASNLGKYIPGKIFMLAGRVELARKLGVRPTVSLSALALEHVMLLVSAGPFLMWVLLRGFQIDSDLTWLILVVALAPAVAFVVCPSLLVAFGNLILRAANQPSFTAKLRPGDPVRLLALYFMGWLAYGASGVFLLGALGLGSALPFVDGVAVFVAAWMIGFLSLITPGGIGVREGALVLLLGSAVPAPEAITVALVARLSWTLVEMGGVVLGVLIGRRSFSTSDPLTRD